MQPVKKSKETLEAEVFALQQELRGTQEMLAFVLLSVGEEVVVTKEALDKGIPADIGIRIDEDLEKGTFVFKLETLPDDDAS